MAAVALEGVCVDFPLLQQDERSLKRLVSAPLASSRFRVDNRSKLFVRGLNNIDLTIHEGDRVGVIGLNGAGKSTLLRVVAGIYPPTSGRATIVGRVGALLSAGLGLRDDVSGFDNIQFCLLLLGIAPRAIPKKRADIIEFAELGDFADMHVGAYSSGMRARLAFAIATSIEPEVLVLDEIFGAGDATFINKANSRMASLISDSHILLFATHNPGLLRKFCNKAVWLERGAIRQYDTLDNILRNYDAANAATAS